MQFDVAIIGAGVSGALTARELSRYNMQVALIEKGSDVAVGSTKANSAIVHAGFDAENGTLKAKLNVEGTALMPQVCKELNVPYKNIGSLVVAYSEKEMQTVQTLYERGVNNGVPDMRVIDKAELKELEPMISDLAVGALWAPSAGIVCPYELTIAAAVNAAENGVGFFRNCEVKGIEDDGEYFTLDTAQGEIKAKYVINAAGVYSDTVARMIGDDSFNIIPRKGEYYLLDKSECSKVKHTVFVCPTEMGKGILLSPTVDGNVLAGPTSIDIEEKDDVDTTAAGLKLVSDNAPKSIPTINLRNSITSFTGIRAHTDRKDNDFVIGQSEKNARFINVAGIESPGLSSAPAIGKYVADIVLSLFPCEKKADFNPERPAPVRFREMSTEERKALIEKDKRYGRIICRCETVTEGEIIDAIQGPVGAIDMDGVKRRTRAGMGRCQSGFCGSKVVEILARELGKNVNDITKYGGESKIIYERTK
ncbi:MAG: NAD(P)/FAD-dependent oxidoreductase [Clostridia bacterium]|nr:NAD(P)/FAD-dependent oxidoreductase [Clostridia bacterium]